MATKGISLGVYNQTFRCFNCGRNSVKLWSTNEEEFVDSEEELNQTDLVSPVFSLDPLGWITYCSKCGWTDF